MGAFFLLTFFFTTLLMSGSSRRRSQRRPRPLGLSWPLYAPSWPHQGSNLGLILAPFWLHLGLSWPLFADAEVRGNFGFQLSMKHPTCMTIRIYVLPFKMHERTWPIRAYTTYGHYIWVWDGAVHMIIISVIVSSDFRGNQGIDNFIEIMQRQTSPRR